MGRKISEPLRRLLAAVICFSLIFAAVLVYAKHTPRCQRGFLFCLQLCFLQKKTASCEAVLKSFNSVGQLFAISPSVQWMV